MPEETEALVQEHLDKFNEDKVLRLAYARHLIGHERMSNALTQLQILSKQQPDFPESWLLKGLVEHQLNQYSEATGSLERFLNLADQDQTVAKKLSRGMTQALLMLAQMAESRKDWTQVEVWLARITDGEEMLSVQTRRASLLIKQGKINEALALINAVPEKQGSDQRAKFLTQIQLLRDHGQLEQAYLLLETENARLPNDADLLYEQAMVADKLNRFQDMERLLRSLLQIKPDYHHALNALGYALADRNERLTEAKELIEKALTLAPDDPFITDSLGWVEFRLGHFDKAEALLRKAFTKRADAEIAIHLAEVLWKIGRQDEAKSFLKQAKQLQADHPALLPTMQRLGVQ
jgi:Flp pilus assembly protein TadD